MEEASKPLLPQQPSVQEGSSQNSFPSEYIEDLPWYYPRQRWIMCFVSFLGFVNVYALRVCLSVGIEPMAKQYHWSDSQQGLALSAFFAGYIFTQIPGGYWATRFGAKWVLGVGITVTSVLTLITPAAAHLGLGVLVAVRVVEGIGEGVSYPAMHALLSQWTPKSEQSSLVGVVYSGAYFGTVLAFPVSSQLASALGWPSIFYFFGSLGILWFLLFIATVYNSPSVHPFISHQEREYILATRPYLPVAEPIPWRAFATNLPLWAIVAGHFATNWGFYTLLTWIPQYFKDILNFNLKKSGFFEVLPYLVMFFVYSISGWLSDRIINWSFLSDMGWTRVSVTLCVRRFNQSLTLLGSAVALVITGYVQSVSLGVFLMTLSVGFMGFCSGGYTSNHADLYPQFAGVLMGITNTIGTIPGIVSPYLTGVLLGSHHNDISRWRLVFYISAIVNIVGAVLYVALASAQRQISKAERG